MLQVQRHHTRQNDEDAPADNICCYACFINWRFIVEVCASASATWHDTVYAWQTFRLTDLGTDYVARALKDKQDATEDTHLGYPSCILVCPRV
jgi:hypothetical protein